ncbi:histone-lysine N-methyltransferase SETMAR [Trichonephila clavipes]|nr:histone-lysine N-methyltransferase SETMAR [Trichonephila clavipes]
MSFGFFGPELMATLFQPNPRSEESDRSGRPSKIDNDVLRSMLENNPHFTSQEVAEEFGIHHTTVRDNIKSLGFVLKRSVLVPHELTEKNLSDRRQISEPYFFANYIYFNFEDFNDYNWKEITDFVQSIPGFQERDEVVETWMACDAVDCGFQMLNNYEIVTSVQEESDPVDDEMDED